MIELWLTTIRDHPERPPVQQRYVLVALALRLDWTTGRGFAGIRDLMADADVSKNTVMRATSWAQNSHLLLRTRRGHYINAKTSIASEWRLTRPGYPQAESQGPSGGTLESQGPNGANPMSQSGQPKVPVGTTHQESSSSESSSSARASAGTGLPAISGTPPDLILLITEEIRNATGRTIGPQWAARTARFLLDGRGAANPDGYVRAAIRAEPDPKTRFLSLYDNQDQT